jgi:glycosyltransferase involved in cell wall biosynthesis/uncharacterized membrane protein YbhN (UPF0104 family)
MDAPILFITRKWAPASGGMETYSMRLVEALAAAYEPVETIALKGRGNAMPPTALALLLFPFTVFAACLRRTVPPRVIHLGDMALWPLGLLVLVWPDAALLVSAHGTDVSYHRRGGLRGRLYGAYLRAGARLLGGRTTVIANSRATRDVTAETGWRQIAVVPLASDFAAAAPHPAPATILFAGRLVKLKGLSWFVREVLPLLPDHLTLDVAGTVWDANEAQALADPRVRFLGPLPQDELAQRFAAALCVIVPNIETGNGDHEGFGLVAPEAAAAGGVVLAARHGGLTDAVLDGETGMLLPPGEATAWAAQIVAVAAWPPEQRAAWCRNAAARSRSFYSWSRVAADTYALYGSASAQAVPAQGGGASGWIRRATRLAGAALLLASLFFVGLHLAEHWPGAVRFAPGMLALAGGLYALTHITTTLGWLATIRACGHHLPMREGFAISLVSQAAKYIPGNVAHHIGRAALAKQAGLPLRVSSLVLPVEIACVCFAALLVGGFLISQWLTLACLLALAALGATRARKLVLPILAFAIGLGLAGVSFALLVDVPQAVPAYPVAWLAGFLLPGAPAGLGVREAALLALLDRAVTPEALGSAIIVHRVITAVVDGLVALAAYFAGLAAIHNRAANSGPTSGK